MNFGNFGSDFNGFSQSAFLLDITSVPTLAVAQVSSEISDIIESLHREAKRIKVMKIHRFKETGLEEDEMIEILEKLLEFKDNYDDNFEL